MKKIPLVAFILASASLASAQTWFKGTLDQAMAAAKEGDKLVLLDFFRPG